MSDLRILYAVLKRGQRRAAWNAFLRHYGAWLAKVLAALAVAAAVSPILYWPALAAAFLVVGGTLVAAMRVRGAQVSDYQTALHIDRAAHLQDRLSTAVYFAADPSNSGILQRQRADAVAHAEHLDVPALFPVRVFDAARIPLALLVLCAALFTYRLHSEAPILALLKHTMHSQFVKAMVKPIVHAMERQPKEPQNAAEQVARNQQNPDGQQPNSSAQPGAENDAQRAASGQAGERQDTSRSDKQKEKEKQDQASGQAEDQEEQQNGEQQQASGQQQGAGQQQQQGNGQRQQQARNGNGGQSGQQQQQQAGARQQQQDGSGRGNQSLAQSVVQALKNLFSKPNGGQSAPSQGQMAQNQAPPEQQPAGQNSGQSPNSASRAGQSGQDASSNSPQQQDGNQQDQSRKSGTGVGTQPGTPQDAANSFLNAQGRREVVEPPVQKFQGEALVRAHNGDGVVTAPVGAAPSPTMAASSGAEQENVPLRYRVYVQRYFDRAAKARKAKQ